MSLIEEIRKSNYYDFNKLLNKRDFNDLGEYVNIYDKTNRNLLFWFHDQEYEESNIIKYIDKYYRLFDYDKIFCNKRSLLMHSYVHGYSYICSKLFIDINFVKEIMKKNCFNENILCYVVEYNFINTIIHLDIINLGGILNKPFDISTGYIINNTILSFMVHYYQEHITTIPIMINYFGILNKPSIIKKNIYLVNKLILVYGKY
jgi:hypothetical protein